MTQQKHIPQCGGILSSHFLDCVPKAVHSPSGHHHQGSAQSYPSALLFNTSTKVSHTNYPSAATMQTQQYDSTDNSTSPASPTAAKSSKLLNNKKEKKLDEKGADAKVKRSRHMPLACPFHYLSHTRCDTKTCSTRKLYSKTNSPLHDYQYRTLKTLYSNHKPHRTMFMKRVKVLFRQHAPNGQKAFEELLKELKQNQIVNQSEIDQCIQQEQEQLQQKRKSPKAKKKTPKAGNATSGPTKVKKQVKNSQVANQIVAVGTKRKAITHVFQFEAEYKYNGGQQQQNIHEQAQEQKAPLVSSGSIAAADEEDFSDFDPTIFSDYGRTYNLRNKRRRIDDPSSESESEESPSSVTTQEESDFSAADEVNNSVMITTEPTLTNETEPKPNAPNFVWYEYDADQCDMQVVVKNSNGDWIVQENGGEKFVDMEDEDLESNLESDDEEVQVSYHHHDYPLDESDSEFPLTHEVDVAELLIDMMNTE